MKIRVEWYERVPNVVLIDVDPEWTWTDFYEAITLTHEMVDQVDGEVDVIIDVSRSGLLPSNALSNLMSATRRQSHPRLRNNMIVGANVFIRAVGNMMMRINPLLKQTTFFPRTLEDADQLLAELQAKSV